MSDSKMVERLRVSRKRGEEERQELGRKQGRTWAQDEAETRQLELLEGLVESVDWGNFFVGSSAYSWGDAIVWHMSEDDGEYRTQEFWEAVAGPRGYQMSADEFYVRGFVEGALE